MSAFYGYMHVSVGVGDKRIENFNCCKHWNISITNDCFKENKDILFKQNGKKM